MDKRKLLEAKRKWIMYAKDLEQIQHANAKRLEDEKPAAWPYEHVEKVKTQVYDAYQEYLSLLKQNKDDKK